MPKTTIYDAAGNRTSVKDGLNQETTSVYDGFNRLTSQTFANGDTTSFTYNAVQKLSQTSPRGITTTYTYDVRDRVTATSAPGLQRNHSYDVAGRLLSVSEPANPTANVSYTYDVLGRVLTETSRGITHSYAYDIAGNRTQASYGTGRVVTTTYDAFNRPATIVEGGRTTSYGYDLGGRAVMLKAGNGQTSRNVYDELGRLKQRTLYRTQAMTAGDELAQFAWTHDLLGNVTTQSETWPGEPTRPGVRTTSMAYDANNRLTNETIDDPTAGVTSTTYAYDHANNRSSKVVTGGTEPGVWSYEYNAANQLTSWAKSLNGSPAKTAALTYDDAGNRIAQSVTTLNSQPETLNTQYAWDSQDRLSSVTMPDGSQHAYKYDYRTRRLSTTRSGGILPPSSTAILFAGGLSLAEWEVAGSVPAMANAPSVEYTRGPDMGGGVGGMLYSLRGGAAKYSVSNGRGDVVAQSDQSAALTWTASYEAYGKRTKETGTNADKQRANTKDEDPTGLLNEGFRYRDLETGVWLSRDPAGFVDGPNVYCFVQQNPWTKFDPHGLNWFSETVEGDFHQGETSWGGVGGQTVVGFIPIVGQVADARDTIATGKDLWNKPSWGNAGKFGMAVVGWIPGLGDLAKGAGKVGRKAASEGVQQVTKKADEAVAAVNESAQTQVKKAEVKVEAESPPPVAGGDAPKKTNLNSNDATSNFGIYEIEIPAGLEKIGKADLNRVTKSSGLPTRLHQQVRKLEKVHGEGNVKGTVVEELGVTTTGAAKAAENARIKSIVDQTGQVPPGNQKSYNP